MGKVNAALTFVILSTLGVIPFFINCLLTANKPNLQTEDTKAMMGSLYLEIRTEKFHQYSYSSVFLVRRMVYAILTVSCKNNPNICIHVFLFTNLLYLVYFGHVRSHDSALARRMEFFNEVGLQLTTYHLALFPLMLTVQDESIAGWIMIAFICGIFFFNLTVIVVISVQAAKRNCYLSGLKKKHAKAM